MIEEININNVHYKKGETKTLILERINKIISLQYELSINYSKLNL